jgi:class 3 adenylate cyclase
MNRTVVFIDICSSSKILENLRLTGNVELWVSVLKDLEEALGKMFKPGFEVYKFLGDGWILISNDHPVSDFYDRLSHLCEKFDSLYISRIKVVLEDPIKSGLTFGIDHGPVDSFEGKNSREYIGRCINVAARLQGSVKFQDDSYENKAVLSNAAISHLGSPPDRFESKVIQRTLNNILGNKPVHCWKLIIRSIIPVTKISKSAIDIIINNLSDEERDRLRRLPMPGKKLPMP